MSSSFGRRLGACRHAAASLVDRRGSRQWRCAWPFAAGRCRLPGRYQGASRRSASCSTGMQRLDSSLPKLCQSGGMQPRRRRRRRSASAAQHVEARPQPYATWLPSSTTRRCPPICVITTAQDAESSGEPIGCRPRRRRRRRPDDVDADRSLASMPESAAPSSQRAASAADRQHRAERSRPADRHAGRSSEIGPVG